MNITEDEFEVLVLSYQSKIKKNTFPPRKYNRKEAETIVLNHLKQIKHKFTLSKI